MRTLALALALTIVACTSDDEPPPPEPGPVDGAYRLTWDCAGGCTVEPALFHAATLHVFDRQLTYKDAVGGVIEVHGVTTESEHCISVPEGVDDSTDPPLDRDAYQLCAVELTVTGAIHWTRRGSIAQATWNLTGQQ